MSAKKEAAAWAASERAAQRAYACMRGSGIVAKVAMDGSGKAAVECASAEDAATVARLTGGKVAPSGHGHPAHTVVVAP